MNSGTCFHIVSDEGVLHAVNDKGETPLLWMLQKRNCTVEVIHTLLQFGSDVNSKDNENRNSLSMALEFSKDEDIIKLILESGVNVNDSSCPSPLCLALHNSASKSVLEHLLDAGCSMSACVQHGSALHCALDSEKANAMPDVFQLLIDRGADVNAERPAIGRGKERALCFALQFGIDASIIQLLIDAGAPLNTCDYHKGALFCATYASFVKADVIKVLLQAGATEEFLFTDTSTPLRCALVWGKYEMEAIKLLFGCSDPNDRALCLRAAVYNAHCNPSVVKLLLKHGVEINGVDREGDSALHVALGNKPCLPSVIKALLENGADVNLVNSYGETPLHVALVHKRDSSILEDLLAAGAFIKFCMCHDLMARFFLDEACTGIKVLLNYFFLQMSLFDAECDFQHGRSSAGLLEFRDLCMQELQKMKVENIGEDLTLYEFLSEYASPKEDSIVCELPGKKYSFDQLLKAVGGNSYPMYLDVISAKVGKLAMTSMLEEIQVYTKTCSFDNPSVERKIILNYESVCSLAQFIPKGDLLRLVLAWYNPNVNLCTGQAGNEKNNMYERKAEFVSKCSKDGLI